ncbi:DUF3015 family protein [Salinisphaera sp. Q1T1-3]|uniref:DUF3015 family protein n=1 Tax=Salinisphaera sp. Q1T1-3 TaxID=2321229 RepID=UPI000E74A1CB|nr:DUF3015 family protein [Salinisphaera sp. Q1T1-3]RJS95311.1 DUF3015 domain-containing protein [Salinisphaera sp. Q1T1-3]
MRRLLCLGAIAGAGLAAAGCSQITVTSDTLVNGTARIADATTNAVQQTSDATTNASRNAFAQNHDARRKFVHSQYAMLKSEAARGRGEDLDALAYMMREQDKQAFADTVQAHYQTLFSGKPSADAFLSRLYGVVGTPSDMSTVVQADTLAAS